MRLWSVHPRYLDSRGLVALWREALLARAVLCGATRGYRNHPQLDRFQSHPSPVSAINAYLADIHAEASLRSYSFDPRKAGPIRDHARITVTDGQLAYEWQHLLRKLLLRSPACFRQWCGVVSPKPHPLFDIIPGPIEQWERMAIAD